MSVSAVIIARNEEKKIERCLKSINWVDEIILVDTESEDSTSSIAKRYHAKVYNRAFDNFSNQKNFGINKANSDWILSIDADEVVSPELRDSILKASRNMAGSDGFYVRRKNYIFGRYLRFGGQGPEEILRVFRKDKGRFVQPVHEKVVVDGECGVLDGFLLHYGTESFKAYKEKLISYTDAEAEWLKENKAQVSVLEIYVKPALRFIYFYIFKLGFLDGKNGLLYQLLSSYYYHLKYRKTKQLMKVK